MGTSGGCGRCVRGIRMLILRLTSWLRRGYILVRSRMYSLLTKRIEIPGVRKLYSKMPWPISNDEVRPKQIIDLCISNVRFRSNVVQASRLQSPNRQARCLPHPWRSTLLMRKSIAPAFYFVIDHWMLSIGYWTSRARETTAQRAHLSRRAMPRLLAGPRLQAQELSAPRLTGL